MNLYLSDRTDPTENLALEALLHARSNEDYLLVYINDPSVIVGRNQCPGAEADLDYCRRAGIRVIRRISGGGTVYHDGGNVNYSFITSGGYFPAGEKRELATVCRILAELGIGAESGPRGEITVEGKKISGTASFCRSGRCIFHGTLLFDTDLDALHTALKGNPALRGKKIASVPSPVTNIRAHLPAPGSARDFAGKFMETALRLTEGRSCDLGQLFEPARAYAPEIIL